MRGNETKRTSHAKPDSRSSQQQFRPAEIHRHLKNTPEFKNKILDKQYKDAALDSTKRMSSAKRDIGRPILESAERQRALIEWPLERSPTTEYIKREFRRLGSASKVKVNYCESRPSR